MKISSMFTPIRIGSMTVPNRFVVPLWETILQTQMVL